jgi:hypothetical protein
VGITTGELQVEGTTTVAGTKTNELVATDWMADEGTEATTDDGTLLGTLVHSTTAKDEAWATTWSVGRDETHEAGRTTGEDQVEGTSTGP